MEKYAFELFGLTLLEPLSVVTNWVMAAQCLYYYQKLKPSNESTYWSGFFLAYGLSFFFGGFSHLFYEYWGLFGKIPGWSSAVIGITLAEWGMVGNFSNPNTRKNLRLIILAKIFATAALLIFKFQFLWVLIHTFGLLFFVGIPAAIFWKKGQGSFRYFVYGVGWLLLSAPVKLLKIDIHPIWFTRDDIGHVFIILTLWMFWRGAKALE